MLDFTQFKQLKDLNDLKSHQTPKFIVLPEDLKTQISYKSLLSEATWSDLRDLVNVFHISEDRSMHISTVDGFDMIDLTEINKVIMIDFDDEERTEFVSTFENEKALENFLDEEDYRLSDAVYLEFDDQMIEELVTKTREDQIKFYDQKIAKAKLDIKLATKALKKYEAAKEELNTKENN